MTRLAEFLFPAPARRTLPSILGWWERRRLAYNVWVGAAGAVTLVGIPVLSLVHPFQDGLVFAPWQGVVAFGVAANLFYGLGAPLEWAAHRLWGRSVLPVGPALYRMGLTFSVGLALVPVMALGLVTLVALVAKLLGLAP
jgi:hypothetical protein